MQLGELITKRRADLGGSRGPLTFREMADAARTAGYKLTESTIAAFINHPLEEPPRRRTMEALARALRVPYADVVDAVAESMGGHGSGLVEVVETAHVRAFAELTEARTPAQREAMLNLVRSIAAGLDDALGQEVGRASAVTKDDYVGGDAAHSLRDVTS